MTGRFRRAIRVLAEPWRAEAEIEDDFHHFAVEIRHDGCAVTAASGRAIRYPWSQCPMAASALQALAGLPIGPHPAAAYVHLDPFGQCTHMLEAAALAVTQAARGPGARRYDVSVTDPVDGRCEAALDLDDAPAVRWTLQGGAVVAPPDRAGLRPAELRGRALATLPPDEAEKLLILRRAVWLAASRGRDIDQFPTAASMGPRVACFVFRPGFAELAKRRYGSVRDFSTGPGPLPHLNPSGDTRPPVPDHRRSRPYVRRLILTGPEERKSRPAHPALAMNASQHILSRGKGSHSAYARGGDLVVEWYDFGEHAPYESANLIVFAPASQRRLAEALGLDTARSADALAAELASRFSTVFQVREFAETCGASFSRETNFWP